MTRLVWTPRARDDLIDVYVTIASENRSAAERYLDLIEAKVLLLGDQPRMGVRRPEIGRSVRVLVAHPYLVLYETIPDADVGPVDVVEIVRVVDGLRDLSSLL